MRLASPPSEQDRAAEKRGNTDALLDGALDTLGSIFHVLGDDSFAIDQDTDPHAFQVRCREFAAHIENGSAVEHFEIPASSTGSRNWTQVRRFYADRRRAETKFVTEKLDTYRDVVEDLLSGLRQIGERNSVNETQVRASLRRVEIAVSGGQIDDIKAALSDTVEQVTLTFQEQQKQYESQLGELNTRMSTLRQDLIAAREEMKRDALTDVYNRGAFDASIEQTRNLHFVLRQAATLLMVDLDNFKEVNDRYGHAAGDAVLRAIGECLERAFIRKGDLVCRYGGDEFAVILNDTSAAHTQKLAERFVESVRALRIPVEDDELSISCSVGFTEITTDDTVESFIKRADQALYDAKAAGRNTARMAIAAPDNAASDA